MRNCINRGVRLGLVLAHEFLGQSLAGTINHVRFVIFERLLHLGGEHGYRDAARYLARRPSRSAFSA